MSFIKKGIRLLAGLLAAAVLATGLLPGVTIIQFQSNVFLRALCIILALQLALVIWDRWQRRSKRPTNGV